MMFLYIDPGTGSMLFSLFIGIATAAVFGLRALLLKFKFSAFGSKEYNSSTDTFVIFSDHKRYFNVFKPICDEFERRKIRVVYLAMSQDDPVFDCNYKYINSQFIGDGNKAFAKLNMLNADVVVSTTPNLEVYQWKKSKNVKCYVHIPHSADELAGYRMFGLDYYDAVLVTGKNQVDFIRQIEALRPGIKKKEVVCTGSITLDNLRNRLAVAGHRKKNIRPVVLLAPSWGKSGILSRYGKKLLSALCKCDCEVIARPHPQTIVSEQNILQPLQKEFSGINWNFDNDNFEVLNKADVIITDFSGIIFDFACVFDRPVIYADSTFDTLPYDADWLTEERWSLKILPMIGVKLKESDFECIDKLIVQAINSKELSANREIIRNQCWENKGQSARLAVDYLVAKQKEVSAK